MINEFKTKEEAELLIKSVIEEYIDNPTLHSQGKSGIGLKKLVSFVLLAQPSEKLEKLKDDLIKLRAKGFPILEVEWQPKWTDQMDLLYEVISVTVEIKLLSK